MDSIFKKALQVGQKNWEAAKKSGSAGFTNDIPDGRYRATIVKAEPGFSKTSQRPQITWHYRILDGDMKGKTKYDYSGLETENNLKFLARMLVKLGYELPEDLSTGLEEVIKDIIEQKFVLTISLKTKDGYQNVWIDEVVEGEKAEEVEDKDTEFPPEESVEISTGSKVTFKSGGNEIEAEVLTVAEEVARVRASDGKVYKLAVDKLALLEEVPEEPIEEEVKEEEEVVPEEPEEEPVKKSTPKKTVKKIIKKKK